MQRFLFITSSDFSWRLERSLWTNLRWVFVECCYFLKPCCNYVLQVSFLSASEAATQRCAKQLYWNHTSAWVFSCKLAAYFQNTSGWLFLDVTFTREIFVITNSDWALILESIILSPITSLSAALFIVPKLASTIEKRQRRIKNPLAHLRQSCRVWPKYALWQALQYYVTLYDIVSSWLMLGNVNCSNKSRNS